MERLEDLDELDTEVRIIRFKSLLKNVVVIDDLFPPEDGVREPARPPRPVCPKVGHIALILDKKERMLV
jgi:hypothetical protein